MNRDTASLFDKIKLYIPEDRLFRDEPMHRHTTFRVGGRASIYVRVASSDELIQVINTAKSTSTDFFLIGNGSNLLVSDEGFDGIIIELGESTHGTTFTHKDASLTEEAPLGSLVVQTVYRRNDLLM